MAGRHSAFVPGALREANEIRFPTGRWEHCRLMQDTRPVQFEDFPTNSTLHAISLNARLTSSEPDGPCSRNETWKTIPLETSPGRWKTLGCPPGQFCCGTDKGTHHQFTHLYASFLERYRHAFTEVAEVGLQWCGSLRMWLAFFPKAVVHGLDIIDDKHIILALDHRSPRNSYRARRNERIRLHGGVNQLIRRSQSNALRGACLDLFIDDGGHTSTMQVNAMLDIWPLIRPGGFLIVEDLHTSYRAGHGVGGQYSTHIDMRAGSKTPLGRITAMLNEALPESPWPEPGWAAQIDFGASMCGVRVNFYGNESIPRRTATAILRKRTDAPHPNPSCRAVNTFGDDLTHGQAS